MDEIWLEVVDLAVAVEISKQAIHKRLGSFVTRKVKGLGHAGHRYQLLLSSLPEAWQAAYWRRVNALPLPWQDALEAQRAAAALPAPLPLPFPISPSAPVPIMAGACPLSAPPADAGSVAPAPPQVGGTVLSSSVGGEDSAAPAPMTVGAAALSAPSTARIPALPDDDTTSIKEWQRACLHARLALLQEADRRRLHQQGRAALVGLCAAAQRGELPPELQRLVPGAVAKGESLLIMTIRL